MLKLTMKRSVVFGYSRRLWVLILTFTIFLHQYHTVWEMNDKELKALLRDILAIDKIIFDQQLGIEWYRLSARQKKVVSFQLNIS